MAIKTSITLPEEVIAQIKETGLSRSAFILEATQEKLAKMQKEASDRQELVKLNKLSKKLKNNITDVLSDQSLP